MSEEKKEKESRIRAQGTIDFHVSGFPSTQWVEWDKNCKEEFGDCRWLKILENHKIANYLEMYKRLQDDIESLKVKVQELEQKIEGGSKPALTFKGNVK